MRHASTPQHVARRLCYHCRPTGDICLRTYCSTDASPPTVTEDAALYGLVQRRASGSAKFFTDTRPLGGMGLQTSLDLGDGLCRVPEEDGMHAKRTRARHAGLRVVQKDDLLRPHAQPLTRQLVDAPLRLLHPLLVRIHDQVTPLAKPVPPLLFLPGAGKAVAENSGAVARAQAGEVSRKLDI